MNPIDQMMQMFGASSSGMLSAFMGTKANGQGAAGQSFADMLTGVTSPAAPGKFAGGQLLEGTDAAGMSATDYMFAIGPYSYTTEQPDLPATLPDMLGAGAPGTEDGSMDADTGAADSLTPAAPEDGSVSPDQGTSAPADTTAGQTNAQAGTEQPVVSTSDVPARTVTQSATPDNAAASANTASNSTPVQPVATERAQTGGDVSTETALTADGADAAPAADSDSYNDTGASADDAELAAERAANAARAQSVPHPKPADVTYASVTAETLDEPAPVADLPEQASATAHAQATSAKSKAPSSPDLTPSVTELADEAAADAAPALAQAQTGQQKTANANGKAKSAAQTAAATNSANSAQQQAATDTDVAAANQPAHDATRTAGRDAGLLLASSDRPAASATPESLTGQSDTSSQSMIGGGLSTLKGETALLGRPAATGYTAQAQNNYVLNQVNIQIAKAVEAGDKNFTIRLDPPELGRVTVKMQFTQDGVVRAEVVADRRETLDMLRRDSRSLEKALEAGGHKTDMAGLSFSLDDGAGQESAGKAFAEAMLADRIDERTAARTGTAGEGESTTTDDAEGTVLHLDSTDLEAILPYVTAETGIDVRV